MLRIATSLQLGLGPLSHCIDRTEQNMILKQTCSLNLASFRSTLLQLLIQQIESWNQIQSFIITTCTTRTSEDDEEEDDDDMLSLLKQKTLLQSEKLTTISFLKSIRVMNGKMLSKTISSCLFHHCILSSSSSSSLYKLIHLISSSTSVAKESNHYLHASLQLINYNEYVQRSSKLDWIQLRQLQQHIDGIKATSWAFQHSLIHDKRNKGIMINNENDDDDKMRDAEGVEFWRKLGEQIQNVTSLYQSISKQHFHSYDEFDNNDDDLDTISSSKVSSAQTQHHLNEKNEYNDKGDLANVVKVGTDLHYQQQQQQLPSDKILVFSGKGAKSPLLLNKKLNISKNDDTMQSSSLPFHGGADAVEQSLLLRELHSQLLKIEKVDEWNGITNQHLHIVDDREEHLQTSPEEDHLTNRKGGSKSSSFFLGATGSLLDELKTALIHQQTIDED